MAYAPLIQDLVPSKSGCHSACGSATNHGMEKPRQVAIDLERQARTQAEEKKQTAERVAFERANGLPVGSTKAVGGPSAFLQSSDASAFGDEEERPPATRSAASKTPGLARPEEKLMTTTAWGNAIRDRLNVGQTAEEKRELANMGTKDPDDLELWRRHEDEKVEEVKVTEKRIKPSPAFSCQGPNEQCYNYGAMTTGRYLIEGKSARKNKGPELGHYRVNEKFLGNRLTGDITFGYREPTPSRVQKETELYTLNLGPDDLTSLDFNTTRTGSLFVHPSVFSTTSSAPGTATGLFANTWRGGSLMSTATERPDLGNIPGSRTGQIVMNDITLPDHPEDQDKKSSRVRKQPEFEMHRQPKRGDFFGKLNEHYQVGKYCPGRDAPKDSHATTCPISKKALGFKDQMSRSCPTVFQQVSTPASMKQDGKGTGHLPDRSMYRGKKRITHVMHMHKDTDRPPLLKQTGADHDESDPEIVAMVHERAMTFDADTVRRAIEPRRDAKICNIGKALSRDRAGHGSRHSCGDPAIAMQMGHTGIETHGQMHGSIESLKDSTRSVRQDICSVSWDLAKGAPGRSRAAYGGLNKPRSHAAPDFSRKAAFSGFETKTPVKVLPRNRNHEAMEGWSSEVVDGLMAHVA